MLLIPAIDLKDGQCVRLRQGRMEDATVFSSDPAAMAAHWVAEGGRRIHIVDLDGAFAGKPVNAEHIQAITQAVAPVPVQVGGGIRDLDTIEAYLSLGVTACIVGTRAVEDPAFLEQIATRYPEQIILGLDARDGMVATDGWAKTSTVSAESLAKDAAHWPIAGIVYTDIARDGMMSGLNVQATAQLAQSAQVGVIASGGVTTLDDLAALKAGFADFPELLIGAITGRAIYEGTLEVRAGQALLDA